MEPPVKILDNFMSSENCKYLIDTYKDKVFKSRVVINTNDGKSNPDTHNSRTSSTFFIPNTDNVIIELRKKVSEMLDVDSRNIEGIQFLRYMKGERYLWHHDFLKAENISNQRTDTIIVYLNDLEEKDGGATGFFHYKMKVLPKEGRAAWFKNCDSEGKLIKESLHAGEEILSDITKYALNIWIRQKPL
jgi:hypothetical protein